MLRTCIVCGAQKTLSGIYWAPPEGGHVNRVCRNCTRKQKARLADRLRSKEKMRKGLFVVLPPTCMPVKVVEHIEHAPVQPYYGTTASISNSKYEHYCRLAKGQHRVLRNVHPRYWDQFLFVTVCLEEDPDLRPKLVAHIRKHFACINKDHPHLPTEPSFEWIYWLRNRKKYVEGAHLMGHAKLNCEEVAAPVCRYSDAWARRYVCERLNMNDVEIKGRRKALPAAAIANALKNNQALLERLEGGDLLKRA